MQRTIRTVIEIVEDLDPSTPIAGGPGAHSCPECGGPIGPGNVESTWQRHRFWCGQTCEQVPVSFTCPTCGHRGRY